MEVTRMPDLLSLPTGTEVRLILKGNARDVMGTVVGPYTRDVMPAMVIDRGDGTQVAVGAHTVESITIIGWTL
jgi:hypothetical protein